MTNYIADSKEITLEYMISRKISFCFLLYDLTYLH